MASSELSPFGINSAVGPTSTNNTGRKIKPLSRVNTMSPVNTKKKYLKNINFLHDVRVAHDLTFHPFVQRSYEVPRTVGDLKKTLTSIASFFLSKFVYIKNKNMNLLFFSNFRILVV